MKLVNKQAFVESRMTPGYALTRVVAEYKNGWLMMEIQGTNIKFMIPKSEVKQFVDDEDLLPEDAIPGIRSKKDLN